ncbi:hypothetical protein DFJ77DRAFT_470224 [Powellomyces hirtus]|nr:hypothetical protein DFJ77DRAFT_470224 [Powellomyces hirtus]
MSSPTFLETPEELKVIECETALELFASFRRGTPIFDINAFPISLPRVRSGELLDLCGPLGGGKTELVMRMITLTILPRRWSPPLLLPLTALSPPVHLGGSSTGVLVLDCDLRFSLRALRSYMKAHITKCVEAASSEHAVSEASVNVLISSSLARLQTARPSTALELLATLIHAEHSFLRRCQTLGPLIVIDSLSPFYWINRLYDLGEGPHLEPRGPDDDPVPQPASFMHESVHRALIRALRNLKDNFHCGIVVTRWEMFPTNPDEAMPTRYSDGPWATLADRFCYVWREQGTVRWKKV